jgi:hypothetical protein
MREKAISFRADDSISRRWKLDQLFAWWIPAIRAGTAWFKVCTDLSPKDKWESCNDNVIAVRDGQVVGIFLGRLKRTTFRFAHLWQNKRCMLSPRGITTVRDSDVVPCHMQGDDWPIWWERMSKVVLTELGDRAVTKRPLFLFKVKKAERDRQTMMIKTFAEDQLGCEFHTQIARMIFRNGTPEADSFFIGFVMQHTKQVDIEQYLKPALLNGPLL